jgi:hypothetical protein
MSSVVVAHSPSIPFDLKRGPGNSFIQDEAQSRKSARRISNRVSTLSPHSTPSVLRSAVSILRTRFRTLVGFEI